MLITVDIAEAFIRVLLTALVIARAYLCVLPTSRPSFY